MPARVAVPRIPPFLVVTNRVRIPGNEIHLSFARSGGPGGQHVNKTESKVIVRWTALGSLSLSPDDREWLRRRLGPRLTAEGEVLVTCDTHRDQHRNVDEALERLVHIVRDAIRRPTVRRKTRPTRASRERRLTSKRARSERKRDRRDSSSE
jgi:ribosome-associated protein